MNLFKLIDHNMFINHTRYMYPKKYTNRTGRVEIQMKTMLKINLTSYFYPTQLNVLLLPQLIHDSLKKSMTNSHCLLACIII